MSKSTLLKIVSVICLVIFTGKIKAQILFSEINYHSDTTRNSGEWVELYNTGAVPVDISSWIFSDAEPIHYFILPPNTILQPGSYFILSNDTSMFRSMYPSVTNVAGPFNFGLGNKGDMLRLFDSQSILQISMTYSDSAGWPKTADGHGRTLERRNMTGNADDPVNWYAGCMGGSPGSAPTACTESVIFSEINYHSDPALDFGDWVEIRNIGTQPVDLSNWILRDKSDSNSFFIPSGMILQPGQNMVVCENRALFEYRWWAGDILVTGDFPFGLKNSKDALRLFDAQGKLYYSIAYRSDGYWPTGPDGGGNTLEILDVNGIANDGQNWFSGCIGGSPGKNYTSACALSIASTDVSTNISVFPNPFTTGAMIEITNTSFTDENELKINVVDALGRTVMEAPVVENNTAGGIMTVKLERGNLVPGIYFFTVNYEGKRAGAGKLVIEN